MIGSRLTKLLSLIQKNSLNAYILPRTDQYQSQYLAPCDQRVQYLTNFTGSNALAVVTQSESLLYTDGRYWTQAQQQLKNPWKLGKIQENEKRWFENLRQNYPKGTVIGFDPRLITASIERTQFFNKNSMKFAALDHNLVDLIWQDRPKELMNPIFSHQKWSGRSIVQKVEWVRSKIVQKNGQAVVFAQLSQIAWILNLRSSEIPHNPFFKSLLVITKEGGRLYLPADHPSFSKQEIVKHLQQVRIQIRGDQPSFQSDSLIKKSQVNFHIFKAITNPIQWQGIGLYRAVRTQKQINGFKRCHLADAVAMAKFWGWRKSQREISQYQAAMQMDKLRMQQPLNMGTSFDTISAGGPNGAIIHYRPLPEKDNIVTDKMIHLLDGGGQYLDGTTDVTRAFHFGSPSQQQKQAYTRVLLGNLDIQRLRWPAGRLNGSHIDVLARRHLWNAGLDYMHGTGHGVGHFLSVHQGPVGISRLNKTNFVAGMIVTNEPGYYKKGQFGIRIENMLLVTQKNGFNQFQVLTMCPYDRNLIDYLMLTKADYDHIDRYHQRVWRQVSPFLINDQRATNWLSEATAPLA